MRVLAVTHSYPRPSTTGAGIFIHRLHMGLQRLGIHVDVLQLADWAPPWPLTPLRRGWREFRAQRQDMFDVLDGIRLHHPATVTPVPSRFFPGDHWDRQVRTLVRYCRRRPALTRADVVLGHFFVPDGYHALGLGRALGLPVFAMGWGDDVIRWPQQWDYWRDRLRQVLTQVDIPIACSRRMVSDGNAWLEKPRTDWEVVYAGVELDRFHPVADSLPLRAEVFRALPSVHRPGSKVLLMLAMPTEAKGYGEMLEAWSQIAPGAPDWHLVMAGMNVATVDVPAELRTRGLTRQAYWIGPQPAESIPRLLQASDAFVLPSHTEGLSLSMLEAMATGLPTIVTDVGGHREVLGGSDDGWLIPRRDVGALVKALQEMTGSPEERARRGAGARASAQRIGTPLENARRLSTVLRRVNERAAA